MPPPWTPLWSPTPINTYHGLHIPLSVLHSVSNHTTGKMVQIKWGPFRDKFHQYVLHNLSSIVTNPVQSKILNTSYITEWWTDFTADTSVSVPEQNIIAVNNGSSIPDKTSLTDDSFLTTEAWIYCGILAAVIAILILAGVCHTINFIINHSNSPIHPTQ